MRPYSKEQARALSELLDTHWDPVGVYKGAAEQQAPPGEYEPYAGWIYRDLLAEGGKTAVVARMRTARRMMGLRRVTSFDDQAADRILEWWRAVSTH